MNIYRIGFIVRCPNNNKPISYAFELRTPTEQRVMVEDICAAVTQREAAYHEDLADDLLKQFGGQQVLRAHHHGVDIETHRGFESPGHGRLKQRVQIGATVYEKGVETARVVNALTGAACAKA